MIPYARHILTGRRSGHVICPTCGLKIDLVKRKDRESFSGIEYARHYQAAHSDEADPELPKAAAKMWA